MAKRQANVIPDIDDRDLATIIGWTRVLIGTAMFIAPRRVLSAWVGDPGSPPAATVAARATGARDAAIGLGTLLALEEGDPRRWLEAGGFADAADALAVLADFREIGGIRRLLWAGVAAASAWVSFEVAEALRK